MKYGKDEGFGNDTVPVIAGLSNTYSDYVATFEEYQASQGLYPTLSLWI